MAKRNKTDQGEPAAEETPAAEAADEAPAEEATSSDSEKLSAKEAAAKVLSGKRNPMSVAEIAEAAMPLTNLGGKTPKQTFYSVLYAENKKSDGLFERVEKGKFKLRKR